MQPLRSDNMCNVDERKDFKDERAPIVDLGFLDHNIKWTKMIKRVEDIKNGNI